ncbi:hypothetical protein [Roseibium alexandrii]|uniref:Uncharacterized protein n=1 Tax=Roseibium alexandrii TaxID=388408 RepID=A0A0M6ZZH3_9HYPH|nr:hypothetical protein [Roseibium alexandrii]CTQ67450.1 hypothetical protein LAX5112_01396 [Roseibium alexandrii]
MSNKLEPGYMVFEVFALEVYRKDPELFSTALELARQNGLKALKQCKRQDQASLKAQLQAVDSLHGLAGLMTLLAKDKPEDLPDLGPDNIRI